jgi:hypothetical protein
MTTITKRAHAPIPAICPVCGTAFLTGAIGQKFCRTYGEDCSNAWQKTHDSAAAWAMVQRWHELRRQKALNAEKWADEDEYPDPAQKPAQKPVRRGTVTCGICRSVLQEWERECRRCAR